MANTYTRIIYGAGGTDDKRLKVSGDDTTAAFLEEKVVAGSTKVTVQTLNPGADEDLEIDVDQTQIDHDQLLNYDVNEHRALNDAATTTTSLWSSDKIQTELDGKINAATPMTDNKLVKSVGTSGIDVEATDIDVDDLNNVTGINDLTIDGDLTVNGTTTSVNSNTLDVTDANITVNNGGNQASADAQDAGITVEMSDATDASIGYDSTTQSKFRAGEVGTLHEILTTNHTQTIINKTIDVDNNTVSNIEVDNLKTGVLETDLNNAVDDTKLASAQAVKTYVAQEIATVDEASEISYSNATSGLTATDVQAAIDEVEGRVDTAESSLSAHLDVNPGKHNASQIVNTPAGDVAATTVQGAINELDTEKLNITDFDSTFDTRLATKTTTDLTEGTNEYFTAERAQDAIGTILANDDVMLLAYDDVTPNITATLDVTGRAALNASTIATGDEVLIYDVDASAFKKITYDDFTVNVGNLSTGDIKETSFALSNNISVPTDVTSFAFANGTVRSFTAHISVFIDATGDLFEAFTITGIQKGADWDIAVQSAGDISGVEFSITSSGQIQYTSANVAGFTAGTLKFRADTTSV